jgi:hypothetical protein
VTPAVQLALDLAPRAAAPDLVVRLRALGLPPRLAVALHRNTRVMVTLDPRRGLRVHHGYAAAPDEVLRAIVRWARPGLSRAARRAAARELLAFRVPQDATACRPRRRAEAAEPGDDARLARLQLAHLELNDRWFGGGLRPVTIRLSGRMRRKLGHYEPGSAGAPAIVLSRRHLRRDGWTAAIRTLLHEMVHQWQDENGLPLDHGAGFRRKAREVGIEPRAVSRVRDLP